ncbi:hypothetical protein [Streptomyces althioticus]|uniref:hypothetical protein n=1 Tax=Streptomyces TaxID=1883 RepID=UPI00073AAEC8|nr:hypothetical protein ASR50_17235 [Streptomyces sp. 4F]MCC9687016.1 hypothetical protein [Streptomyces sp. MNU103]GGQ35857.1 hypothetical protein GCM10010250_01080 [Streptomyces althioticus]
MNQRWPEGRYADPDAARARYEADTSAARRSAREALRADLPAAHLGLAVTVIACLLVGAAWSPAAAWAVAGAFAALFTIVLTTRLVTGKGIRSAVRTAYTATFGWADWI